MTSFDWMLLAAIVCYVGGAAVTANPFARRLESKVLGVLLATVWPIAIWFVRRRR